MFLMAFLPFGFSHYFLLLRKKHQTIMENHQRMKHRVEESDQDYITTLPNSLLRTILSSLSIREAVKTSVLSSRWKYVWTSPNNLILDADNILERARYSATNILCRLNNEQLRFSLKLYRTRAFVANVNEYLSRLREFHPHKIEKFRVCFTFRRGSHGSDDLDRWISFAIGRNVEEIDLCLWENNELSAPNCGALYVFPCDIAGNIEGVIMSSLKCLRLAHCTLAPQKTYNCNFTSLTTLDLMKVDLVSAKHIQIMLASCHSLEWLSFTECYNMNYLKIEHPFCQHLKYLNVSLCRQLRGIVVNSSNLETMEYTGLMIEFVFDAPRLKTFFSHTSDSRTFFRLAIALPQLETFFLESSCTSGRVRSLTSRLPTFPNLRHLTIMKVATFRHDPWWIAAVLKVCPKLGRLELHLRTILHFDEDLMDTSRPPRLRHDHLKEAAITGIRGHASEIKMAIYLAQNACALQKMTIDPRPRIYLGNGKCGPSDACGSWSKVDKQKVHEDLNQAFCSQVELLIL